MKAEFYATCPAGLEIPASRLLARTCREAYAIRTDGGCVFYELPKLEARKCLAFQNNYVVLARARAARAREAGARFARDERALKRANECMTALRFRSFRVMFSDENTLSPPDPQARSAIERAVKCARVDRVHPDTEILILRRADGEALMLLRAARREDTRKSLAKGALSNSACACLIALARPTESGSFLDPFAGSGALAKTRAGMGPYKSITASDTAPGARDTLALALSGVKRARVEQADALSMDKWFVKESATELVTDPPWGLYKKAEMAPDEFHSRMLESFAWACAPGARVVVLTAEKDSFARALAAQGWFKALEKFDCLINGKKACAYVMEKREALR